MAPRYPPAPVVGLDADMIKLLNLKLINWSMFEKKTIQPEVVQYLLEGLSYFLLFKVNELDILVPMFDEISPDVALLRDYDPTWLRRSCCYDLNHHSRYGSYEAQKNHGIYGSS